MRKPATLTALAASLRTWEVCDPRDGIAVAAYPFKWLAAAHVALHHRRQGPYATLDYVRANQGWIVPDLTPYLPARDQAGRFLPGADALAADLDDVIATLLPVDALDLPCDGCKAQPRERCLPGCTGEAAHLDALAALCRMDGCEEDALGDAAGADEDPSACRSCNSEAWDRLFSFYA